MVAERRGLVVWRGVGQDRALEEDKLERKPQASEHEKDSGEECVL